jgi:hypothetical protein
MTLRFGTLGPAGSCHENATKNYLDFHSVKDADIALCMSLLDGLEDLRSGNLDYLIQCSAHLDVHLVTEKYYSEVFVTDTFIYPTKELVLLEREGVANPRTLGLVKATEGYLDGIKYEHVVYEISKPVVGAGLLAGKYDAGLTYPEYEGQAPGEFRVRKYIGRVLTTWLVYGRHTVFKGSVVGTAPQGFYDEAALLRSR